MSNEYPRKPKGSSQSSSRSPRPSRDASGSRGSVQRSGGRPAGNSANAGREDRSAGRGADARRGSRDASGTVGGRASGKRIERPERSGSARGEHPRGDSAAQRPQRGAPARSERSARTENPRTERPRAERGQYAEERDHGQRAERGQDSVRGKGRPQGERSGRGTAAGERSTGERGAPARGTSVRGATGRGTSASAGRGAPAPESVPAAVKAKLSQAERFPKAEFARREGLLEGFPAVMVVNRSLKGYAYRKEFPWCLRLAIAYAADSATGQPLPKEERMLEAFEQNLFGLLKKSVNGHYVGHTTWGGSREFVFYLDDGGEAEEPLEGFAQAQKRELELSLDEDVRWEQAAHYFDYRD